MTIEVLPIATAVAQHMGSGWSAQRHQQLDRAYLHGPDGAVLFLRVDYVTLTKLRLVIKGVFGDAEKRKRTDEQIPVITVAVRRNPAAIAADIHRRLLPGYLALLVVLRERHAAWLDVERDNEDRAERLRRILPAAQIAVGRVHCYGAAVRGSVQVKGEVSFDIRIPVEYAEDVARLLADIEQRAQQSR